MSDWSEEGCWLVNNTSNGASSDRVTCHCDHLTNFAVLVVRTLLCMNYKQNITPHPPLPVRGWGLTGQYDMGGNLMAFSENG